MPDLTVRRRTALGDMLGGAALLTLPTPSWADDSTDELRRRWQTLLTGGLSSTRPILTSPSRSRPSKTRPLRPHDSRPIGEPYDDLAGPREYDAVQPRRVQLPPGRTGRDRVGHERIGVSG